MEIGILQMVVRNSMHTITVYNENEVKGQREFQNLKSEDKIWIDLADPTDNDLESFVDYFHL